MVIEKTSLACYIDLQKLADSFITNGKTKTLVLVNKIIKLNKLTKIETTMLLGKLKNLLINNGYILKV